MLNEVYLGLGSNLGDPSANISQAVQLIGGFSRNITVSSLYKTSPQGFQSQPAFFNSACRLWTALDPFQLMARLIEVESSLGRRRTFRNAPRVLDLDILIYSRLVMESPLLTIPHPRMAQRAFVLVPLAEIAPELRHPASGETIRSMMSALPSGREAIIKLPFRV